MCIQWKLCGFSPKRLCTGCRGTSLIRRHHPPEGHPKTLGIGPRKGPRGVQFRTSEVPLYPHEREPRAGLSLVDTFSSSRKKILTSPVILRTNFHRDENLSSQHHCKLTNFGEVCILFLDFVLGLEKVSTNDRPALHAANTSLSGKGERCLKGYLAHEKHLPRWTLQWHMPWVIWWSQVGGFFRMSEVPL